MTPRTRAALAGSAATAVWGLLEPVDMRLFRCDYSDVAVLGKLVTRGRRWRAVGFAWHMGNGALFGIAWHELSGRRPLSPVTFALVEHLALFPLATLVDRHHPARGTPGVRKLFSGCAFAQATVRHVAFGWLLGALYRRSA